MTYQTHRKSGFMLVMVLIVTAVGLLFGAGALLLFRYQCQMRIDRQHELEKVYAVRSALNYIRTNTDAEINTTFTYYTGSGRRLGVNVRPVERVFPNVTNVHHLIVDKGQGFEENRRFGSSLDRNHINDFPEYEYGMEGTTNLQTRGSYDNKYGLAFMDTDTTNIVRRWVNISMRDTGGWLQEDYGRRYYFYLEDFVGSMDSSVTNNVIRFCLIRNLTNELNEVGRKHGWPLSMGERALVLQIRTEAGDTNNNAEMTLSDCWCGGGSNLLRVTNFPTRYNMGLQIAHDNVSLFYINNQGNEKVSPACVFSGVGQMSSETYEYFRSGIYTNANGKVVSPDLSAVFEVETPLGSKSRGKSDFLTDFRVTPAYQYDVSLIHPSSVTNRATVAQKTGKYHRLGYTYTVLTYDTHGTEHKGFRYDEKHAEENR